MRDSKKFIYDLKDFIDIGLTPENCFITELLNSASIPNLSIAEARVGPFQNTVSHRLIGTEEFYYIIEGKGKMFINEEEVGEISKGMIVHIPSSRDQYIKNTSHTDLIFLCICTPRFKQGNYQ